MWVQVKSAPNLMMAEMWKEFFEAEGIPTRILPEGDGIMSSEMASYKILVPRDRSHLIEEVLKKV